MKTKVWSLSIRLFHWFLAIGFTSAYILGDDENSRNLHYAFGLFVGTLIIFRILYGIIGPKYANFKDFPLGFRSIVNFIKGYFSKENFMIGHNPIASIVMILIFVVGLLCSFSGYMLYSKEGAALFTTGMNEEFLEEIHEIFANLFLILVGLHIVGLISDMIFHGKIKTIFSIFTGYKNIEGENSTVNTFQRVYAFIWLIIPFLMFYYGLNLPSENKNGNGTEQQELKEDND